MEPEAYASGFFYASMRHSAAAEKRHPSPKGKGSKKNCYFYTPKIERLR